MSKKGIRALVYVSLVSVAIWGATGYLVMGSRACIVMGAPPGKGQACDILRLTCLASSGAGHFLRRRESKDNGKRGAGQR